MQVTENKIFLSCETITDCHVKYELNDAVDFEQEMDDTDRGLGRFGSTGNKKQQVKKGGGVDYIRGRSRRNGKPDEDF